MSIWFWRRASICIPSLSWLGMKPRSLESHTPLPKSPKIREIFKFTIVCLFYFFVTLAPKKINIIFWPPVAKFRLRPACGGIDIGLFTVCFGHSV